MVGGICWGSTPQCAAPHRGCAVTAMPRARWCSVCDGPYRSQGTCSWYPLCPRSWARRRYLPATVKRDWRGFLELVELVVLVAQWLWLHTDGDVENFIEWCNALLHPPTLLALWTSFYA